MKRLIAALALVAGACATSTPAPPQVPPIDAAMARPPFDRAFWSVLIEEEDGRVVYARNEDKLTIPASNRKLFGAAAIVDCLGADGRLVTTIWRDGEDLVLVGDGDPSLGSWRYERSDDFERVAETLQQRGVMRVRDVIADVSAFDRETIPGGWKHGNIGSDYAAPVDALAWGESEIANDRAVADAALHAATALRDALFARGIQITGTPRVQTEPRVWSERLLSLPSPFVAHLLSAVMKNSHNLYAEMLLKRISPVAPASYDLGLARERAFLTAEVGLDPGSFRFVDGSGLAPDDLLTPRAAIAMLRWMNHPSRRGLWWSVLAQPNNEGTLRRRLVTLEHRVRAKTGTINGVNALSGIIAMNDGSYRYFSVIVNHHIGESSEANGIIDEIVALAAK